MTREEKFTAAVQAEVKEWALTREERSLVIPFMVCVNERMNGRDGIKWFEDIAGRGEEETK